MRSFLDGCGGLEVVDLSPLCQVTVVHPLFLSKCASLRELNLSPLSCVTEIGAFFLAGCAGLTGLDLSPLARVRTVHGSFLAGCTGLSPSLDVAALVGVTTITLETFLAGCTGLLRVCHVPGTWAPTPSGWELVACEGDSTAHDWGVGRRTV